MRPRRRRVATVLAIFVSVMALLAATFAVLLVVALSRIRFDFGPSHRVKPIPVAQRACPYLHAVRTTGNAAAESSLDLVAGRPSARPVDYPTGYAAQLAAFDLSLRVAATKSPAPLRRKLNEAAANVEVGRALIGKIADPATYFERSLNPMLDGTRALGDANDLVGDQCGFVLNDFTF